MTVADRNVRATVRLADDALARDNVFHFVVSPEEPVDVIIGERSGSARIRACISPARSPSAKRRASRSRSARPIRSRPTISQRASVVILNDAPVAQPRPSGSQTFVQRGGGLFVVAGERGGLAVAAPTSFRACPARPSIASRGAAARLGALEYGHPLFEVFRGAAHRRLRVGAVLRLSQRRPRPGAATLARFDDGQPALLERRVGTGRVLMWTSTLDTTWNDLALKPVFLPFVHRVVRYLGAYREPQAVADRRRRRRARAAGAGQGRPTSRASR